MRPVPIIVWSLLMTLIAVRTYSRSFRRRHGHKALWRLKVLTRWRTWYFSQWRIMFMSTLTGLSHNFIRSKKVRVTRPVRAYCFTFQSELIANTISLFIRASSVRIKQKLFGFPVQIFPRVRHTTARCALSSMYCFSMLNRPFFRKKLVCTKTSNFNAF